MAVFAAMVVFSGWSTLSAPSSQTLINWGANYGSRTMGGEYWRTITSAFVHIGILHLFMNMWVLTSVGPIVERLYGPSKFAVIYFCAAFGGSLLSLLLNPKIISAGASGAVFGVFGAWLAFFLVFRRRLDAGFYEANMASITVFLIYNLAWGMMQRGIDNAAHVGGLLGGIAAGMMFCPRGLGDLQWRIKDYVLSIALIGLLGYCFTLTRDSVQSRITSGSLQPDLRRLEAGKKLYAERKYAQAAAEFTKVIAAHPDDAYAYDWRANVYLQMNKYSEALTDANQALLINPKVGDSSLIKAHALLELRRYREALDACNLAVKFSPGNSGAYVTRSIIHDRMGESGLALKDSSEAIRLNPREAGGYSNRGKAYIGLGLVDEALKDFSTALSINPASPTALSGQAQSFYLRGDAKNCIKACNLFIQRVGWKESLTPYVVLLSILSHRHINDSDGERAIEAQADQFLNQSAWPFPIILYFEGKVSRQQLMASANDTDKLTEANAYVGLDLLNKGQTEEALPLLDWVKKQGNQTFDEYDLVQNALSKMKR
ncbi:MAG TPA: rhomboid family intramembrane serine protease [Candidatus Obscuribacterales bacterium]